jgi:DNA modification methylase
MNSNSVDAILTSPPYANRYDYTRTYALELVYLGCNENKVKQLLQDMLSCTVENKDKQERLYSFYNEIGREVDFHNVESAFHKQEALQEVLTILDDYQSQGMLNNSGIASLVRNYFYEMCFAIYELARILKPGGTVVVVNDNVRYVGEEVPVDLILSDIAESFGLTVKHIWTLGRGKGNSSQQMGKHGRTELRKCVYVWEKDASMAKV